MIVGVIFVAAFGILISFGIGFEVGRNSEQSKPPKCPWKFCGIELHNQPLVKGYNDRGDRVYASEQCYSCNNWIIYDGSNTYVRLVDQK